MVSKWVVAGTAIEVPEKDIQQFTVGCYAWVRVEQAPAWPRWFKAGEAAIIRMDSETKGEWIASFGYRFKVLYTVSQYIMRHYPELHATEGEAILAKWKAEREAKEPPAPPHGEWEKTHEWTGEYRAPNVGEEFIQKDAPQDWSAGKAATWFSYACYILRPRPAPPPPAVTREEFIDSIRTLEDFHADLKADMQALEREVAAIKKPAKGGKRK